MATWGAGITLKGSNGVSVLFGQGAPASSVTGTVNGQQYFDTQNLQVYTWSSSSSAFSSPVSYRGPMGITGSNASFYTGSGAPTSSTNSGNTSANAIYFQSNGEIWTYSASSGNWTDTGENLTGPAGQTIRGTQTYTGSGAPSSNLSSFTPPAQAGDLYYDLGTAGGPYLYVLGN